jgi:hypothetical protein
MNNFGIEGEKSPILKLISTDEKLVIKALDGMATIIYSQKTTFRTGVDFNFGSQDINRVSNPTGETLVNAYGLIRNAKFSEIYDSLSENLDKICFTQSQIIDFCQNYSRHLVRSEHGNFFLSKKQCFYRGMEKYFIVRVVVHSPRSNVPTKKLDATFFEFAYEHALEVALCPRFFVPAI